MNYYGKVPFGDISDAQTLPSSAKEDSESIVYIGGQDGGVGGQLWIDVYAHSAIDIASGAQLTIELQGHTSAVQASNTSPFSVANQSGIIGASGTQEPDALYYIFYNTSTQDALAFTAGDLITQCAIPEDLFRLLSYDYVMLEYETGASEVSETVDAFVYIKPS